MIPEYDKIFYSDVDIIFRMDLANLYDINIDGKYIAATRDIGLNLSKAGVEYIKSLGCVPEGDYIQSGFIIINSKLIREEGVVEKFKLFAGKKLKYQDQDILNITCAGRINILPPKYNMTDYSFFYSLCERESLYKFCSEEEIEEGLKSGNLHYNGHKPWKKYSVNFDVWWEYYRRSPFYNEKEYFDFYYSKLNEYDQLSLWNRIKILIRYFVVRK